jgi:sorbitol/mannitol transport system permease protein
MPALVFLIVVTQIPFLVTIVMSLFRWNIMYPDATEFGWFTNYVRVLQDPRLRAAVLNTSVMVVAGVLLSLVLGTALALLLNRRFFGRGVVRTLLITPFLIMPMASSLMWKHLIYNPEYGLINGVLGWLGQTFGFNAPQVEWVSGQPMAAVIVVLVWTWTPFMMLITLAGLQSQDPEVKEAAMIDGAGPFQQFRFLTFRHLRQYLELSTVLGVIYLLNAYDQVFSITQGGPGTATTNLPYEIYITIFRGYEYGEGAAAGVLVVVFSVIVSNFGLRLISSLNDVIPAGGKK